MRALTDLSSLFEFWPSGPKTIFAKVYSAKGLEGLEGLELVEGREINKMGASEGCSNVLRSAYHGRTSKSTRK